MPKKAAYPPGLSRNAARLLKAGSTYTYQKEWKVSEMKVENT